MKNIIIAGATGRLGQSVVAEFSKGDFYLNIISRSKGENKDKQAVYHLDATDANAVHEMAESVIEKEGKVDMCVNLTGGFMPGSIEGASFEDVDKMIQANFKTSYNFVAALLPYYKKTGGGKFVFIGAKTSLDPNMAYQFAAYALSKQLLLHLVEMINAYGKKESITAHILLPSIIDYPEVRLEMPGADYSKWSSPAKMAETIAAIARGEEERSVIEF